MITREEILNDQECPEELEDNLDELLRKINIVRDQWGKPMTVSSGWRSKEDQIRIYAQKGITDIKKIPMTSKHFSCQAVDIYDPKKELQEWIKKNLPLMEKIGVWFEDFSYTPNFVHFQTVPPKSGRRFFIP
jgi:uncharacterized protein YcbK (DUF882 family)